MDHFLFFITYKSHYLDSNKEGKKDHKWLPPFYKELLLENLRFKYIKYFQYPLASIPTLIAQVMSG